MTPSEVFFRFSVRVLESRQLGCCCKPVKPCLGLAFVSPALYRCTDQRLTGSINICNTYCKWSSCCSLQPSFMLPDFVTTVLQSLHGLVRAKNCPRPSGQQAAVIACQTRAIAGRATTRFPSNTLHGAEVCTLPAQRGHLSLTPSDA